MSATLWSKLFKPPRPAKEPEESGVIGPRRRRDPRHPCELPLQARCSSWDRFLELFSGNISARGLFVPTERQAELREEVELVLRTPDGGELQLIGMVVHIFSDHEGRPRGLGIKLDDLEGESAQRYQQLVAEAARRCTVRPSPQALVEEQSELRLPGQPPPLPPSLGGGPRQPGPLHESDSLEIPIDVDSQVTPLPAQGPSPAVEPPGPPPLELPPEMLAEQEAAQNELAEQEAAQDELAAREATQDELAAREATQDELAAQEAAQDELAAQELVAQALAHQAMAPEPVISLPRPQPGASICPVVGIDFGTSMSSVAVVVNNEVVVLQDERGFFATPSIVGFAEEQPHIGFEARELLLREPKRAVTSPKRLLGRLVNDPEIQNHLGRMAMRYSTGDDGQVLLHPPGQAATVPQACAAILARLRERAEAYLGRLVEQAVLTAPVSFDDRRCNALREAARLAGLEVVDIVDEPTAAALSCSGDPDFQDLVAIFDFGGGTFDFSVVDVREADLQVVATAGDHWLGGDDFDQALANAAADKFWVRHDIELRNQADQWQRLLIAAEAAKRALSTKDRTSVLLPHAALSPRGPLHLSFPLTRDRFSDLTASIIIRALDTCREALALCELTPRDIRAVYLSGGTSRIPAVRQAVEGLFGQPGIVAVPPERAVVIGAAMYAAQADAYRATLP